MRKNRDGEKFCHSENELQRVLDDHGADVRARLLPSQRGELPAAAEVLDSHDGALVCYVEGRTLGDVEAILEDCDVEVRS